MSTEDEKELGKEQPTPPNSPKGDVPEGKPVKPSKPGEKSPTSGEDYWKGVATQTQDKLGEERARVKQLETKLAEASETSPERVKELLRSENPDFDDLSEDEKQGKVKERIDKFKMEKKQEEQARELKKLKRNQEIDSVIDSPGFEKLKEKKSEFKSFANQPENKGKDVTDLARAFLFDELKEEAEAKPSPVGLEPPTGGDKVLEPKKGESLKDFEKRRKDKPMKFMKDAGEGKVKEVPKE